MQVKTTMSYHLTKSEWPSLKMLERVWRKENPPTLLVGMQIGAATMENSMEGSLKTKNRATI